MVSHFVPENLHSVLITVFCQFTVWHLALLPIWGMAKRNNMNGYFHHDRTWCEVEVYVFMILLLFIVCYSSIIYNLPSFVQYPAQSCVICAKVGRVRLLPEALGWGRGLFLSFVFCCRLRPGSAFLFMPRHSGSRIVASARSFVGWGAWFSFLVYSAVSYLISRQCMCILQCLRYIQW